MYGTAFRRPFLPAWFAGVPRGNGFRMPLQLNKRALLRNTLSATGSLRLLRSLPAWQGLLILNYHRIGTPGDSLFDPCLWSVTQDQLDTQVRLLKSGFDVIGLDDLPNVEMDLQRASGEPWRMRRFVMVAFDDGYRDNYESAFPVLASHGVPGVFFLATGSIDHGGVSWWDALSWMVRSSRRATLELPDFLPGGPVNLNDRNDPDRTRALRMLLERYYRLPGSQTRPFLLAVADATGSGLPPAELSRDLWLTWDMVREMRASGMSIGAHTVTHPVLSRLGLEEQESELLESRLRLEAETGQPVTALSFPVGRRDTFNQDTREALSRAQYDYAFSFYGGYIPPGRWDRFNLPRTAVESTTTLAEFKAFCALPQIFARH